MLSFVCSGMLVFFHQHWLSNKLFLLLNRKAFQTVILSTICTQLGCIFATQLYTPGINNERLLHSDRQKTTQLTKSIVRNTAFLFFRAVLHRRLVGSKSVAAYVWSSKIEWFSTNISTAVIVDFFTNFSMFRTEFFTCHTIENVSV